MRAVYRQWMQQDVKRSAAESYSPLSLIFLFFFFSFIGWCWEVGYHLVIDHRFINRGMLFGPWLPIYGVGGVMILLVLRHFFERPGKLFFMIMLVCGTIEYLTGWALETIWHTRWWDYREYTFQIQGRVSLIGTCHADAIGNEKFDDTVDSRNQGIIAHILIGKDRSDEWYLQEGEYERKQGKLKNPLCRFHTFHRNGELCRYQPGTNNLK